MSTQFHPPSLLHASKARKTEVTEKTFPDKAFSQSHVALLRLMSSLALGKERKEGRKRTERPRPGAWMDQLLLSRVYCIDDEFGPYPTTSTELVYK